jgi:F-type H+-transporting ATPase subunit epsilon
MAMRVEIVSPESALWAGPASALVARSSNGDFTILAQHTATVGDIVPSVVRVQGDDGEVAFAVHGGHFQVTTDDDGTTLATILAGVAERTSDIDVARAQLAKETAESVLSREADSESVVAESARHALARAELRLLSAGSR